MPYGNPVVAVRLLDFDSGDEFTFGGKNDQLLEYVMERIMSFQFSDHDRKKDQLEMTFRNDDYKMLDDPIFVKGQKLEVTWGWKNNTSAPRRMIVKKVEGGTIITVTCHCPVSLLDTKKRSRFLEGATDSEFVRMIADEYGYKSHLSIIEDTETRRDITQGRWMTDAKMCQRLASRNGFKFYIDATGFHWHRQDNSKIPFREYIYKTDWHEGAIIAPPEFEANLSKGIAKVRVLAQDPILKSPVDEAIGIDDEIDVSLGSEDELFDPDDPDIGLRGFRISEEEVIAGGSLTAEEARTIADGRYRDTAQKRYKCTLTIIGDPALGAKILIGLYGVAETFNGLYYVKEVVSQISSGKFIMTLSLVKDALSEVKAAKKKKRRNNKNNKKKIKEETGEYKNVLIAMVDGEGQTVPAWKFIDPQGDTVATSQLTEEQYLALPERSKKELFEQGVSTYPDR
jgi:hypothetical protein